MGARCDGREFKALSLQASEVPADCLLEQLLLIRRETRLFCHRSVMCPRPQSNGAESLGHLVDSARRLGSSASTEGPDGSTSEVGSHRQTVHQHLQYFPAYARK